MGTTRETDYQLGNQWWTDSSDSALFRKDLHGAESVYKWRNEVMRDWGERLHLLRPKAEQE